MDEINNTSVENKPLIEGSMFKDPDTNTEYRIVNVENDGTYRVLNVTTYELLKETWTKDKFDKLIYIGRYNFRTGKINIEGGKSRRRRNKRRQPKRQTKRRKSRHRRR
jgi:hypothetical protein